MKRNLIVFMAYTLSATLLVLSLTFSYLTLFKKTDVLKDWKISVQPNSTFYAGDILTFKSESIKLIDIQGTATRYLVCDPTANDDFREVPLAPLDLKRAPGKLALSQREIQLPNVDAFTDLPRKCYLQIDACYPVFLQKDFCEHASTDKFTVALKPNSTEQPTATIQTQQSYSSNSSEFETQVAPSQTSTTTNNLVTNNSTTNNTTTQTQPNLIQSLTNTVDETVSGLIHSLGGN